MQTETSMRGVLKSLLQFLLGMGIIALAGFLVFILRPKSNPPDDWKTAIPPNDVMALVEFQGAIWSGGKDGLYRIDPDNGDVLEQVEVENGPNFRFTRALLVDQGRRDLWVGHLHGLSRFDGQSWQTFRAADGLSDDQVLSLTLDPQRNLWIGTRSGLSILDQAREQISPPLGESPQRPISVLFFDQRDNLWAGNGFSMEGGLYQYDGEQWETFGTEQGLAHPMVNSILQTPEGQLWFGTGLASQGGLSIREGKTWQTITEADGLAGGKVRYLFRDQDGVYWVGSEYYGIVRMGSDGWQTFTPDYGLAGWEVKAMLQDSAGNLWLGTENGLTRISQSAWQDLDNFSFDE